MLDPGDEVMVLFVWRRPLAGSTALVKMNVPSVARLAAQLAAEAGVLIHPAVTLGSDDQHMRIGLGRAGFGMALEKFEAFLRERAGAHGRGSGHQEPTE